MDKGITQPQMRAIYKLGSELGLDNGALHEVIYHVTGCTSVRLLSAEEAGRVITRLRDDMMCGIPSAPLSDQVSEARASASEAQKKKLWALMFTLFEYDERPCDTRETRTARLAGLVRKVLQREPASEQYPLNGITKAEISKLIKAAERYIENEKRKRRCD